jgi:type II secretory pathway pseudopilin PulG
LPQSPGIGLRFLPIRQGSLQPGESGFSRRTSIAVLIVGILSAIAIPSYLEDLEKNKEATAISDINIIASRLAGHVMENVLPTNLSTINFGNTLPLIDPWGNPYQYLPISAP